MAVLIEPSTLVIDCADPAALADFYRKATGWDATYADDTLIVLDGGPVKIGLQRVDGYRPPAWPKASAQLHLDFKVADIEAAAEELVALGAGRPAHQPGEGGWIVLTDPAGHPFCVSS